MYIFGLYNLFIAFVPFCFVCWSIQDQTHFASIALYRTECLLYIVRNMPFQLKTFLHGLIFFSVLSFGASASSVMKF